MEKWEEELWRAIEARALTDQIIYAGELITYVQQELVPTLARHRREVVIQCLESGMSAGMLADSIGTRAGTVSRLAEEGRRALREEQT